MGLDYVDIFYHHRPDPETPLEETMEALAQADKAFFPKDYALSRGCLIEYECAQRYHIPTGFYE